MTEIDGKSKTKYLNKKFNNQINKYIHIVDFGISFDFGIACAFGLPCGVGFEGTNSFKT